MTLANPKTMTLANLIRREIGVRDYLSRLSPADRKNVKYARDSLHSALSDNGVQSALIAVGSTVTGRSSKKRYVGSAGPNDIDLKVIISDPRLAAEFNKCIKEWATGLTNDRFIKTSGNGCVRYTHNKTEEEFQDFCYDGGITLHPITGKPIDLIIKNTSYLPAAPHITREREIGNAFVVLYQDR